MDGMDRPERRQVSSFAERRDPYVTRALDAMRANPSRRWTVAALGRLAGLSRAAFARRFTRALGRSPLRWLSEHRIELARRCLLESDLSVAAIGTQVGYRSEFAFAKAFKRLVGMAPGLFRREARVTMIAAPSSVFRAAA